MAKRLSLKWLLLLLCLLLFPILVKSPYYQDVGVKVAIYGILAMGLSILIGQAGQISLGQAALFGVGAYVSALLNTRLGFPFWLSLPLSAFAGAALSLVLGFLALRFKGHFLAMITLAASLIIDNLIRNWTSLTGGPAGIANIGAAKLGGMVFKGEREFFYLAWLLCFLFLIFGQNVCAGRTGRALSALRQNEVSSQAIGIDIMILKLETFILSGIYAGVAGSLFTFYSGYIGPESFTLHFSIVLLSMIVIGGLSNGPWGGLLGAMLLQLLPEGLRSLNQLLTAQWHWGAFLADYTYQLIIYGLLLFLTVLYLPGGLAGSLASMGEKVFRRKKLSMVALEGSGVRRP